MPHRQQSSRRISGIAVAGAAVAMLCVLAGDAFAQEAVTDAVQIRPRPEFDPIGFELDRLYTDAAAALAGRPSSDPEISRSALSSFNILPSLAFDVSHTDNLYRAATDRRSDFITVTRPAVRIVSDWDNHSLNFYAKGDIGRHKRTRTEDFEDHKVELVGRIHVDDFDSISAEVSGERSHEQRGELDDPGLGFGPTSVDTYKLGGTYERRVPDGVLFRPHFAVSRYRFENNGTINNADRWRDDYEFLARLGYEFIPGTTLFVQPRYTALEYRQRTDRSGQNRNTQLLEFLAGATWDASAITFLEAGIGLLGARFDDPAFSDSTKPTARLELTWNATPVVSVKSSIARTFSPTARAGLAGTLNTSFESSVDWEARYNVILGIGFGYQVEDLIDSVPEQSRQTNRLALTGRWLINEYFFTQGEVSRTSRTGDLPTDELRENRAVVTVGAQL